MGQFWVAVDSYATELRSATKGRGQFSLEFDHFTEVPPSIAEGISAPYLATIAKRKHSGKGRRH